MNKQMSRAYILGCIGCQSTHKTLYKLGETARVCGECKDLLMTGETLHLRSGGSLKQSKENPAELIYKKAEDQLIERIE